LALVVDEFSEGIEDHAIAAIVSAETDFHVAA